MNKNAIQKYAIWARNELIEQVKQRAYQYGITDKGYGDEKAVAIAGRALSPEELRQRQAFISEIKKSGFQLASEEVAYTWFNRIIALRFMEVNDYLPTHIRVLSDTSGGFKPEILKDVLHLDLPGLDKGKVSDLLNANRTEELYRYLLLTQCNALNALLPEMFEEMGAYTEMLLPNNILKPEGIIGRLVKDIPEEDFRDAVQIIGWLYQYYNTEPKQEVFDGLKKNIKISRAKIPAATQLFTPDWIVRYMVENSLGRLFIVDSGKWLGDHMTEPERIEKEKRISEQFGWRYYLPEAEQSEEVRRLRLTRPDTKTAKFNPDDIKVMDPCMGSGHILVYAFEVLMQIYRSEGYAERDAAKLILEKNLYGLEIDRRAYQLAYFALMMKARQYNRRILTLDVRPQVYEPTGYPDGMEYGSLVKVQTPAPCGKGNRQTPADYVGTPFEKGAISNLASSVGASAEKGDVLEPMPEPPKADQIGMFEDSYKVKLNTWNFRRLLAQKYDVVVTNPPYMGNKGLNLKMSDYLQINYTDYKSDSFAAFIIRCGEMATPTGFVGMFTPYVWMFIQSYEKLRNNLYKTKNITTLIQFEYSAFEEATVPVCSFVYQNKKTGEKGGYFRLVDFRGGMEVQRKKYLEALENPQCGYFYTADSDNFAKIPGSPVAYWASEATLRSFDCQLINKWVNPRIGLVTGDTDRFLRFWSEIEKSRIFFSCSCTKESISSMQKWFPYQKGGSFRKWYGNNEYVVNWENDGWEMKNDNFSGTRVKSHNYNEDFAFRQAITWTKITSSTFSGRFVPAGYLFDDAGPLCTVSGDHIMQILALLNSIVGTHFLSLLSPTMNFLPGHIKALPVPEGIVGNINLADLAQDCISLSRTDWDSFETSWDFKRHPLISPLFKGGGGLPFLPRDKKLKDRSRDLRTNATSQENHLWYDYLKNHEPRFTRQRIIGEYIADFFCHAAMLVVELDGSQHHTPDGIAYDNERTAYLNGLGIEVIRFPNSAVDKDFSRVCGEISRVVEGRIQTPADCVGTPFKKGAISKPVTSEGTPFKKGASTIAAAYAEWECEAAERFDTLKANEEELNRIFIDIYGLRDELTPEVADKNVTVRRADLGREIRSLISYAVGCMFGRYSLDVAGLAYAGGDWDNDKYITFIPDKDNILPICDDEYFDDDIVGRFIDFVKTVYGADTLEENLLFIANALGGKGTPRDVIRSYFLNDFFKDHCKIFQKRPIYWLFDSGKKNGFKALIYMHRYSRDLLAKLRTDYVHEQQERYRTQLSHIADALNTAAGAERARLLKRQNKLMEQLRETVVFEEKVHHLADRNITIDLDDGVKKNYEKLSGILSEI